MPAGSLDGSYSDDSASEPAIKKKVGRPLKHLESDLNSPHLTEADRRRIRRWARQLLNCALLIGH